MTPKTFRTCEHGYLLEWCEPRFTPMGCESCGFHKPRETPLLVDALEEALRSTLPYLHIVKRTSSPSGIFEMVQQVAGVLVRYKEEMLGGA